MNVTALGYAPSNSSSITPSTNLSAIARRCKQPPEIPRRAFLTAQTGHSVPERVFNLFIHGVFMPSAATISQTASKADAQHPRLLLLLRPLKSSSMTPRQDTITLSRSSFPTPETSTNLSTRATSGRSPMSHFISYLSLPLPLRSRSSCMFTFWYPPRTNACVPRGIFKTTVTFVLSTLLVMISAIFILAASILWSTVIRQAKTINDVRSVSPLHDLWSCLISYRTKTFRLASTSSKATLPICFGPPLRCLSRLLCHIQPGAI